MARDKLIKLLPFRSVGRFNSSFLSEFSIQSNQSVTCRKPFADFFRRSLTSTTDLRSHDVPNSGVPLPEEIAKRIVHLQCQSSAQGGICHVYLVGVFHGFQDSAKEVKAVISHLKPQAVFLELCQSRVEFLTEQDFELPPVPTKGEMFNIWMNENVNPLFIYPSWLQIKTARELGGHPAEEFRVAYREARSYGARIYLGDRPLHITERRISNGITTWHMIKSLYHILFKSDSFKFTDELVMKARGLGDGYAQQVMMKEMDHRDGMTVFLQEMSKAFPALVEISVNERDKYMSQTLWRVARKHSSVVAVVGKTHLSGIKRNWMQPIEVQSLLEVPSEKDGFGISKIFASVRALIGKKCNPEEEEEEDTILVDLEEIGVEPVQELQDEN